MTQVENKEMKQMVQGYLKGTTACSTWVVIDPVTALLHTENGGSKPVTITAALWWKNTKASSDIVMIMTGKWDCLGLKIEMELEYK